MKPNDELNAIRSRLHPQYAAAFVEIAYQINTPEVTTMGACRNGCGRVARGAATCADCLAGDAADLKRAVRLLRELKLERMERHEREARPWRG